VRPSAARLALLCLLVSLAWCALGAAAPLLQATDHADAALVARLLQAPVCHQLPERSLHLAGHPMGLCARCAGLALGFAAGAACMLIWCRRRPADAPRPPSPRLLLLALLPAVAEWIGDLSGLAFSGNVARAAAAMLPGFAVLLFFLPAIHEMCGILGDAIWRRRAPREPSHAARTG
jgi:uncharacterized membrane protein